MSPSPHQWFCRYIIRHVQFPVTKASAAEHSTLGNLKVISENNFKGQKYRFPNHICLNKCRDEVANAMNDFGNRWCE